MTLDEAIRHLEDIAEVNEKQAEADESPKFAFYSRAYRLRQYADSHRQIAEWLKELKEYKERMPSYEAVYNDAKREIALCGEYERAYKRGYDKAMGAIENIKEEFRQIDASCTYKYFGYDEIINIIDKHISGKE